MLEEKDEVENLGSTPSSNSYALTTDIIGDNIDITRSPSQMSVEHRRKSFYWFLLVGLEKRILNDSLQDDVPKADIFKVANSVFVPNYQDCETLDKNFIFHIAKVLVKHVNCLNSY